MARFSNFRGHQQAFDAAKAAVHVVHFYPDGGNLVAHGRDFPLQFVADGFRLFPEEDEGRQ